MARIAINGFGRMGKLALRRLFDEGLGDQVVLVNEPTGDVAQHALLLEFDTVHGRWPCGLVNDCSRDADRCAADRADWADLDRCVGVARIRCDFRPEFRTSFLSDPRLFQVRAGHDGCRLLLYGKRLGSSYGNVFARCKLPNRWCCGLPCGDHRFDSA